tara:strand:- start:874 stop:1308 length:435 start_codon:yes stop_codon:yes gene_type:complete
MQDDVRERILEIVQKKPTEYSWVLASAGGGRPLPDGRRKGGVLRDIAEERGPFNSPKWKAVHWEGKDKFHYALFPVRDHLNEAQLAMLYMKLGKNKITFGYLSSFWNHKNEYEFAISGLPLGRIAHVAPKNLLKLLVHQLPLDP